MTTLRKDIWTHGCQSVGKCLWTNRQTNSASDAVELLSVRTKSFTWWHQHHMLHYFLLTSLAYFAGPGNYVWFNRFDIYTIGLSWHHGWVLNSMCSVSCFCYLVWLNLWTSGVCTIWTTSEASQTAVNPSHCLACLSPTHANVTSSVTFTQSDKIEFKMRIVFMRIYS